VEEVPAPSEQVRLPGLRVLIIDDETDSRELLRLMLESAGARVTSAASSSEAMELLAQSPHDVVLSDIGMPQEDGYSFIKRLRSLPDPALSELPAIALTAFARGEDRRRALFAGYQMHLAKPVEPTELITLIASLTRRI
jgi:CheY-like chemotaxis protein